MFQIQLPLEMSHVDFYSDVRRMSVSNSSEFALWITHHIPFVTGLYRFGKWNATVLFWWRACRCADIRQDENAGIRFPSLLCCWFECSNSSHKIKWSNLFRQVKSQLIDFQSTNMFTSYNSRSIDKIDVKNDEKLDVSFLKNEKFTDSQQRMTGA